MNKESYRALKLFKALSNVVRYNIIVMLSLNKEKDVSSIATELNKTVANISQHLKILKNLDIVGYYTEGNNVKYYLSNKLIIEIIVLAENIFKRKKLEESI